MCAEGAIDRSAQDRLLAAVRELEKLERADTLAELMRFDAVSKARSARAVE
jgi:hypothetical protein